MNDEPHKTGKRPGRLPLLVVTGTIFVLIIAGVLRTTSGSRVWDVLFLLSQAALISIVIWQACDPFADAAQWIGTKLKLPGSVRGATLDAIASSMPELFTGIFFVVLAISATNSDGTPLAGEQLAEARGEGFGATIATCAGSAVYNMILIPAFCALIISKYRPSRPTIDIDDKVISRDGLWFVGCELVLIVFLFQDEMHWWMGCVLILLYGAYLGQLFSDARHYQRSLHLIQEELISGREPDRIVELGRQQGLRIIPSLIKQVQDGGDPHADEDETPETAGVLFGRFEIPLNGTSAWSVIAICTVIAAAACYWLVELTHTTADLLDVPVFFVAVILAAAASSVPDTFLSVGAAMRGDDDGAVSNAFGSNIFDICICLSIPLFIGSYLNGWQPLQLTQNGEPLEGLVGLRFLLCGLTVVTLLIMWHNRQLTRAKAIVLILLYGVFIAYAVIGSLGITF